MSDIAQLIGTMGFWRFDERNARGELSYELHTAYHRQGFMTEAAQAICRFAFTDLKLHSIEANIDPRNQASANLLERIGFKREAYFRENYFLDGKFYDSVIYCLLERDLQR